jgi:hypothetical protein
VQHKKFVRMQKKNSHRTGVLIQYIAEVSHTIPAKKPRKRKNLQADRGNLAVINIGDNPEFMNYVLL